MSKCLDPMSPHQPVLEAARQARRDLEARALAEREQLRAHPIDLGESAEQHSARRAIADRRDSLVHRQRRKHSAARQRVIDSLTLEYDAMAREGGSMEANS